MKRVHVLVAVVLVATAVAAGVAGPPASARTGAPTGRLSVSTWIAPAGAPIQLTGSVPGGTRPIEVQSKRPYPAPPSARTWHTIASARAAGGDFSVSVVATGERTLYRVLAPPFRRAGQALGGARTPIRTVRAMLPGQVVGVTELVPGAPPRSLDLETAAVSDDGRVVAFVKSVRDVDAPESWHDELWRYDTGTQQSVRIDSTQTSHVAVSGDGRYVVFDGATRLDGVLVRGVFAYDADTGVVDLVSVPGAGDVGMFDLASGPDVSADGRYVVFRVPVDHEDGSASDSIFLRDRLGVSTQLVSSSLAGGPANGGSFDPHVSDDGQVVEFTSRASDLVTGDTNKRPDVFVRDLRERTTSRVSVDAAGDQVHTWIGEADLSADGGSVVFGADGKGLGKDGPDDVGEVYVHDLASGRTTLLSRSIRGTPGNGSVLQVAIDADGGKVAFSSCASDLTDWPTRSGWDAFVTDVHLGGTSVVPISSRGRPANDESHVWDISADGRTVLFESKATNLVPGATSRFGLYLWRAIG